jgi:glycosyltransferase involved in cell wall biosynthesis
VRIALASDWYLPRQGGIELHLRDLRDRLAACGHTVVVVTSTPGESADGVHRLRAPRLPGAEVVRSRSVAGEIARILAAERIDLVHAHVSIVSPVGYAATWAARRRGLPAVVTFHSVVRGLRPMMRAFDLATGFSRWGAVVTAVSPTVAREVAPLAGSEGQVLQLPNGIDLDEWRPSPARVDGERDRPRALHVASAMRLHPKKRPVALLRAVREASVRLGVGALRLTIAGEGAERPHLERLAARWRLDGVVTLPGHLDRSELRDLYESADIFASPTRLEAFGLAALEARACGLPVAAMAGSGVAGFIRDGVEGWLARTDRELAGIFISAASDRSKIEAIAAHNRSTAPPNDWGEVLARHLEIYESARGAGGTSAGGGAPDGSPSRAAAGRDAGPPAPPFGRT